MEEVTKDLAAQAVQAGFAKMSPKECIMAVSAHFMARGVVYQDERYTTIANKMVDIMSETDREILDGELEL